jgi:hypothetical protein
MCCRPEEVTTVAIIKMRISSGLPRSRLGGAVFDV